MTCQVIIAQPLRGGLDLVELEVRELLNEYDFPGDEIRFFSSARSAGTEPL